MSLHTFLFPGQGSQKRGMIRAFDKNKADVKEIIDGHFPFYLDSRKCHKQNSIIRIGKGDNQVIFGDDQIPIIAGPCAIENAETAFSIAEIVKKAGIKLFRSMLFKPRSSPYSFPRSCHRTLSVDPPGYRPV